MLWWAQIFCPFLQDLPHKTNLPTRIRAKALRLFPSPAPALALHISHLSALLLFFLLFPLLHMFPVSFCSSYLLARNAFSFLSLLTLQFGQNDLSPLHLMLKCCLGKADV